jgi:hypothetical protein
VRGLVPIDVPLKGGCIGPQGNCSSSPLAAAQATSKLPLPALRPRQCVLLVSPFFMVLNGPHTMLIADIYFNVVGEAVQSQPSTVSPAPSAAAGDQIPAILDVRQATFELVNVAFVGSGGPLRAITAVYSVLFCNGATAAEKQLQHLVLQQYSSCSCPALSSALSPQVDPHMYI